MTGRSQRLAVTGVVSSLALATAAFGAPGDTLTIEASKVNVRATPDIAAATILQLDRGHQVVEAGRDGAWVNVALPGRSGLRGWIHQTLIAPAEAEAGPVAMAGRRRSPAAGRDPERREVFEVQVPSANVRAGPAMDAPVVAWVHEGSLLPVLERGDTWVRVGLDGRRDGWIYGALVAPAGAQEARAAAPAQRRETGRARAPAPRTLDAPRSEAAAPEPEPPRLAEVEPPPAPSRGGNGAELEIPAVTAGVRDQPRRLAEPAVGQSEGGGGATELMRTGGWIEVAAEGPHAAGSSGSERNRGDGSPLVESTTSVAPVARAGATPASDVAGPLPEGKALRNGNGPVEAQAEEAAETGEFLRFKAEVERVNERVRRAAGIDAFAGVEDLGGGAVALTATAAWHAAPEAARRANLETLSRLWASMCRPGAPVVVRVVDDRGEAVMEERRGGEPAALVDAGD